MQHFVGARFNTWNHMGWTETNLLHFSKIVWRILVQHNFAHWNQREVLLRPHLHHSSVWCQQSSCMWLEVRDPANYQVQNSFIKECELKMYEDSMLNKLFQHTRYYIYGICYQEYSIKSLQLAAYPPICGKCQVWKCMKLYFLHLWRKLYSEKPCDLFHLVFSYMGPGVA